MDIAEVPTADDPSQELFDDQRVPPAGSPELKHLLAIVVSVVVIAALYVGKDVLVPIVLAMMLSFILSPLVDAIQRIGISRAPSVVFSVLLAFCVIALAGVLVARQASALADTAPKYAAALDTKVERVQSFAASVLTAITQPFARGGGSQQLPAADASGRRATTQSAGGVRADEPPGPSKITAGSSLPIIGTILAPVLGPVETIVIVVVIAIFMLVEREDLRDRFIRLAGSSDLQRTTVAMNDAAGRLSRYFVSQLAVNTMFGTVIGIGLWLIGIPAAGFWGFTAGLLRFIPYLGPVLAALGPLALGAALDTGWRSAIEVAALFILVEPFTGYVVEPLLYGHSTGLAPISVIIAAVFWTWIWGPIGLIISTPLTLCLVVMGRHVRSLEFFDVLLGDRPALTPAETFYQRMLGNDPDDALERAEAMLEERSLLDYYDGVVLPALTRAAQDQGRGALTSARIAEVTCRTLDVVNDLTNGDSQAARQGRSAAPANLSVTVVCVSGRGTLDDALTAILVQLLAQRGFQARRVPHGGVARDRIGALPVGNAAVILVSYLDWSGSAARLKYLVRRLRRHAPAVKIIVGLWTADSDGAAAEGGRSQAIGADVYVSSLRSALDACAARNEPQTAAPRPDSAS